MVTDSNNTIVHMSTEEAETFGLVMKVVDEPAEVDDELGLAIVSKPTIMEKYGVHCDPDKNSFHKSLFDQYQNRGTLSPKQIQALR